MRRQPTPLDHFDIDEVDDVAFRFGKHMLPSESIADVLVTCRSISPLVVDPSPENVVATPHQVQGTDVIQRISSSLEGAQYVVRVRATMNTGRVFVGAALVSIVKL
jgi:hypothetical protein